MGLLWRLLKVLTPEPVRAWYRRRWGGGVDEHLDRLAAKLIRRHGLVVQAGPFAGMSYVDRARCSGFIPKLLGCYESELDDVMATVLSARYPAFVNVGCAEGYYAVGIARRLPGVVVYAFDADPEAEALCRDLAQRNGVGDRVVVAGACTPESLAALSLDGALLLVDCEGYELELLDPERLPALAACDVLVELHDCFVPDLTVALLPRFESTHDIELIDAVMARDPATVPQAADLSPAEAILAVDDRRAHPVQWAYMTRKG